MAEHIRVEYEQLTEIAKRFALQADQTDQLIARLSHQMDELSTGAWIGQGADAFYDEMETLVFPALGKLFVALDESGVTFGTVAQIFADAEDDASRLFGDTYHDSGTNQNLSTDRPPKILSDRELVDGGVYYLNEHGQWVEFAGGDADYVYVGGVGTTPQGLRDNLESLQKYNPDRMIVSVFNASDDFLSDSGQAFEDNYEGETDGLSPSQNAATQGLVNLLRADLADGTLDMNLDGYSQGGAIVANALNRLVKEEHLSPDQLSNLSVTTYGSFGTDYPVGANYTHIIHSTDPVPFIANLTNSLNGDDSPDQTWEYHKNVTIVQRLPSFESGAAMMTHDLDTYLESANGKTMSDDFVEVGQGIVNTVTDVGEGLINRGGAIWNSITRGTLL
ncbi:MAG: WXG100 family type VII secretion target [Aggregatilineales bacterium]